jgi:hypothetical protein
MIKMAWFIEIYWARATAYHRFEMKLKKMGWLLLVAGQGLEHNIELVFPTMSLWYYAQLLALVNVIVCLGSRVYTYYMAIMVHQDAVQTTERESNC